MDGDIVVSVVSWGGVSTCVFQISGTASSPELPLRQGCLISTPPQSLLFPAVSLKATYCYVAAAVLEQLFWDSSLSRFDPNTTFCPSAYIFKVQNYKGLKNEASG